MYKRVLLAYINVYKNADHSIPFEIKLIQVSETEYIIRLIYTLERTPT